MTKRLLEMLTHLKRHEAIIHQVFVSSLLQRALIEALWSRTMLTILEIGRHESWVLFKLTKIVFLKKSSSSKAIFYRSSSSMKGVFQQRSSSNLLKKVHNFLSTKKINVTGHQTVKEADRQTHRKEQPPPQKWLISPGCCIGRYYQWQICKYQSINTTRLVR